MARRIARAAACVAAMLMLVSGVSATVAPGAETPAREVTTVRYCGGQWRRGFAADGSPRVIFVHRLCGVVRA